MKPISALLVGLVVVLLTATAWALPPMQHRVDGIVESIDREQSVFALTPREKDQATIFSIKTGRTRFRRDGHRVTFEQLAVGATVRLYYKREVEENVATEIAWKSVTQAPRRQSTHSTMTAPSQPLPDRMDLETAIRFALENNFAIRRARERIRQQEGIVTTVSAAALPNISAAGSYQRSDVPSVVTGSSGVPLFIPEGPSWRMTLTASQTVFAGGGVRASIRGAEIEREAAVLDLLAVINEAMLDVRTRFYDVLLAREQIKVQEQNLELLQSQLSYATLRAQAGTVSNFEQLRAEVAVANAKPPLIRSRNSLRLAIEELRRAIGLTKGRQETGSEASEIVGTLSFEPVSFELAAAIAAAQANRPDLRRLENLAAARREGITVARSRYYPSLAVGAGGDLRKGPTTSFGDSINGLRGFAQSRLDVNPRATSGAILQAGSQAEQASLTESEARLAAEVEVRRAFFAIERAVELAGAMQKTVGQAEEAVRLATTRFEAGVATQLDVLVAQVDLTTVRTSQLQANHGYNVAVAQLRKAIGASEVEYANAAAPAQPARAP